MYTMRYYSDFKNEVINFGSKFMELKRIISNEVTQTKKGDYHMFSHLRVLVPNLQMCTHILE